MRTFEDEQGQRWQAAILNASYGSTVLLFSPVHGDGIRQQVLAAETLAEAEQQLYALDEAALCELLETAAEWGGG